MTIAYHPHRDWGPWALDTEVAVLYLDAEDIGYSFDLTDYTTSARVLDLVAQVGHKNWADDAVLAGLVRALDDLLNVQHTLCSSGVSKTLSPSEVLDRVEQWARAEDAVSKAWAVYPRPPTAR